MYNKNTENASKIFYGLEIAKTDYFHIDVMDGKFVPKDTKEQMAEYTNLVKQISNIPLDVHLMVENVKEFIDEYIGFKPNIISGMLGYLHLRLFFHYNICISIKRLPHAS